MNDCKNNVINEVLQLKQLIFELKIKIRKLLLGRIIFKEILFYLYVVQIAPYLSCMMVKYLKTHLLNIFFISSLNYILTIRKINLRMIFFAIY